MSKYTNGIQDLYFAILPANTNAGFYIIGDNAYNYQGGNVKVSNLYLFSRQKQKSQFGKKC